MFGTKQSRFLDFSVCKVTQDEVGSVRFSLMDGCIPETDGLSTSVTRTLPESRSQGCPQGTGRLRFNRVTVDLDFFSHSELPNFTKPCKYVSICLIGGKEET